MDRRGFMRVAGLAAAGAVAAPEAAPAAATSGLGEGMLRTAPATFRVASRYAENGQGFGDGARRLGLAIEHASGGLFARGSAADAVTLTHQPADALVRLHPAFGYLSGLPGDLGLAASDLAAWLDHGGGQELMDDLAARSGLKVMLAGHSGGTHVLWGQRPVRKLEDLAGVRIAVGGLVGESFRALGATPIDVAPDRQADALSQGEVDFVAAAGMVQSAALGLHRVARHGTTGLGSGGGSATVLTIALDDWKALAPQVRSAIAAAAAGEFGESLAEARAHEGAMRHAFVNGHGLAIGAAGSDLADAVQRVAAATIAHAAAFDGLAARIDHSYMAYRAAVAPVAAFTS